MNIESLIDKIELFKDLIIDSGFRRDIQDYIQSIQQGQNQNLVFMKDLSDKVKIKLEEGENYGLDNELNTLLKESQPFTAFDTLDQLKELNSDPEIAANNFFQKFSVILNQLLQNIDKNKKEIDSIYSIFVKYASEDVEFNSDQEQGIVSLIFKDLKTTSSLREFSKALSRWNRTIILYHTLLKSNSPDEISLLEIQNGSIDVIFNIDFDIAIDFTELVKVGLKVYGAYLIYKSKAAKEIIESYMGNKKLIEAEKERETLMLDNIKASIKKKAIEQHKERIKEDKDIETTGVNKKSEEVSKVLTDHIIKGNEVKLLTPPEPPEGETKDLSQELKEETAIVRERFKQLSLDDKKLLLERYTIQEDQND